MRERYGLIGESRRKGDRFDAGVTDKTRSSWASPLAKEREIENAPDVSRLSSVGKPTDRTSFILAEIPSL
jgi:hypothetical protein